MKSFYNRLIDKFISPEEMTSIINDIDEKINLLTRKERRTLLSLIRSNCFFKKENLIYYKEVSHVNYKGLIKIHELYEKVGLTEELYYLHWSHNYADQKSLNRNYDDMVKPLRKDNKDYINYGSGGGNRSSIRYPKKCRKTAWKRFYKLFPKLKPKEEE